MMTATAPFVKTVGTVVTTRDYKVTYLPELTSKGQSAEEFVQSHGRQNVGDVAYQILLKKDKDGKSIFVATTGVIYRPVVLLGESFADEERTNEGIRKVAHLLKFVRPPMELATLIRENISNEQIRSMGLSCLTTMHEPVEDSDGYLNLLSSNANGARPWLDAFSGSPRDGWVREGGFVFLSPQEVGSKV